MSTESRSVELLSQSFSDSLKDEVAGCLSDIMEVGLDNILEDGIIKDIPFISTAISVYQIGNSVRDRYNLKKLAIFLNKINQGAQGEETRQKYTGRRNTSKIYKKVPRKSQISQPGIRICSSFNRPLRWIR